MTQTNRYKSHQPPTLPLQGANPYLANYKGKLKGVRTQAITLGPTSTITIARIKIPSPEKQSSHLIKRFDTNAISATSFFKCAFPLASEKDEEAQMKYLNEIYDTRSAGALDLGPDHKLTGVWVPVEHATEIAEVYGLTQFAAPLIAFPNPNQKPAVVTSSTTIKKEDVQPNQTPNKPNPTERPINQSKQVDQTPTTVRSTKRSKVAPCFGNTSPSNFNLTKLNKSNLDSKKLNPQNPTGGGTKDSIPTSVINNQTAPSTNSTDDHNQQKKAISETDNEKTKNLAEATNPPPKKLIGTEEEVNQAKEEALKLVSSLRSSSSTSTSHEKNSPDLKTQKVIGNKINAPINGQATTLNRKRSLDEALEEDQSDQQSTKESSSSLIRSSFLKKSFWRRSNQQSEQLKKRVIHSKKDGSSTINSSDINTGDDGLNSIDSTKRNLALAGIVIAGAAASIVPYFF